MFVSTKYIKDVFFLKTAKFCVTCEYTMVAILELMYANQWVSEWGNNGDVRGLDQEGNHEKTKQIVNVT